MLVGRLDYNPTDKTQMYFRGGREGSETSSSVLISTAPIRNTTWAHYLNQSYLYSSRHTFSPNVFLSVKVELYALQQANSFDTALTYSPEPDVRFAHRSRTTGRIIQMPGLENFSEPGEGGVPFGGPQNTIQFEPDLSWTKGKHSLRFGGLATYIQLNYAYGAYAQAVEAAWRHHRRTAWKTCEYRWKPRRQPAGGFRGPRRSSGQAALPGDTSLPTEVWNADDRLCAVQTPLTAANYARSYRYKDWATYGQDSYKATPQLTLTSVCATSTTASSTTTIQNLTPISTLDPVAGLSSKSAPAAVHIADESPVGRILEAVAGARLLPASGFAYDLFGNGRDSIRGGYGISYERNFGNVTFNASFNPPASAVSATPAGPEMPVASR